MSSSSKKGIKKRSTQEPKTQEEPSTTYMKQRIARVNKVQKSMRLLCDKDCSSPEDIRPFFLRAANSDDNSIDNSSDEDAIDKRKKKTKSTTLVSDESDKEKSGTTRSKSDKDKNNTKNKSKKRSESSDSEDETNEKKSLGVKSKKKNIASQNDDSSSGKEFQKSKISSADSKFVTKLAKVRENRVMSADSNSGSASRIENRTMISNKQSLQFKSRVVKILNKFKQLCSEYELQMERVKWKDFKKELTSQESAGKVIDKSKNVINSFKTELDEQEKELVNFYEEWVKNCAKGNIDEEDSASSENEIPEQPETKEKSDQSKAGSNATSIVSECDVDEIFSGNETNVEKKQKKVDFVAAEAAEKMDVDDASSSKEVMSPVLGGNKDKATLGKASAKDNSKVVVEEPKESPEERHAVRTEQALNDSVDDIFDDSTIENVIDMDESSKEKEGACEDKSSSKTNEEAVDENKSSLNTEEAVAENNDSSKSIDSSVSLAEMSDRTEKEEKDVSNDIDDEERAKRAMLESDSETPPNEESPVEGSVKESNIDDSSKEKDSVQVEKSKPKEDKIKAKTNHVRKENSSDEQDPSSTEVEKLAKRTLLESNSDDSASPSDTKRSSDKKQDSDVTMDDSSSDTDSKSKTVKADASSKEKRGKKMEDTSKDQRTLNFKQQTDLLKLSYSGSDEKLKMPSEVVVKRLPEKVLAKHKVALKKSREYLESKEIKSLTDLGRLRRNRKSLGDSVRKSRRVRRKAKEKEAEDSLLDHVKDVGDGALVEDMEEHDDASADNSMLQTSNIQTTEELIKEADAVTKNILLHSSDSDFDVQKTDGESNDSDEGKKGKSKDRAKKSSAKEGDKGSDKENEEAEQEKSKWKRDKLLTRKFSSDSDSSGAREKWKKKQKTLAEQEGKDNSENGEDAKKIVKRMRRTRRKIIDSDSDVKQVSSETEADDSFATLKDDKSSDSDFSVGRQRKMRKRKKKGRSSDTDSSVAEKRSKPKRRRIKNMSSDSDEKSDDQITNSQGTPGKKGRKNIRKVMKDKQVADDTKQAAKEEEERVKRIAERQKLYNEMYEARLAGEEKVDKLVLDFNPDTKEELVTVNENLVKRLKPHQAKGIKFMWDACFESLEQVKSSTGSGCIIAHCMGLGKTLQVIALVHTLLTHEATGVKTIMVVCPLSTVLNWANEFKYWLKDVDDDINVFEMTKLKKNMERKWKLEQWQRSGGVLMIGYEMFRNLSGTNNKMRKNMKEAILQCLIDPGPDLIVCDEGHLLKNEDTALSKSIKRIKTLRRIVLTGTPLQNNLTEYHCMVQFVKPSLLGTKREFLNRFVNPITNGQFDDSTEYDVKLMKKRAYVLHKMLKGCVQRFDYSVLTPFLPPKQEYVIFVSLSEVQINMYRHYLENFARFGTRVTGSLFGDFQALQRIWTHPVVLKLNAEKIERMNEKKYDSTEEEGSLKDFIDDGSDTESTTSSTSTDDDDEIQMVDSNEETKKENSRSTRTSDVEAVQKPEEPEKKEEDWWTQFVQPEHFEDIRISSKLVLLFGILKECEQIGDKVLLFSQSLYSLTLVEQFLAKIDDETQNPTNSEFLQGHSGNWSLGLDYFRLDGQTSAENRNLWCRKFNQPSNTRARLFLISTKAGGLGINLTAANRVIIFDASWNPSHDVQSIFRVYRFGQKKPCYVYRFLAAGTMEEKIYNRQVTKLSLSCRVVDEQQIERHYSNHDLNELYKFEPNTTGEKPTLNLPKDRLLAEIFLKYKDFVENYHEHDSLLENKAEEELNEEERKQAWLEYEEEKKGKPPVMLQGYPAVAAFPNHVMMNQYNLPGTYNISTDYEKLRQLLQKDYPNASPETQQMMTTRVLTDMYSYWEQQAFHSTANRLINQNANVVAPMQIRTPLPNLIRKNYVVPNVNKAVVNQPKDNRATDVRTGESDDDIVEVTSSSTVSNKNKNQEE